MSELLRPPDLPPQPLPKPVIGLIGAIGAGKSKAANYLVQCGGFAVNADALGHQALERSAVIEAVAQRWGKGVLKTDGSVDRRMLAGVVFPNPPERAALEGIVFPVIKELARAAIAEAQANPDVPFVVLDAAVMLEAGWNNVCDWLVYIDAPLEVRLARVQARSGWSASELLHREASQWPADRKKAAADAVVSNASDPAALHAQLDVLLIKWQVPAQIPRKL